MLYKENAYWKKSVHKTQTKIRIMRVTVRHTIGHKIRTSSPSKTDKFLGTSIQYRRNTVVELTVPEARLNNSISLWKSILNSANESMAEGFRGWMQNANYLKGRFVRGEGEGRGLYLKMVPCGRVKRTSVHISWQSDISNNFQNFHRSHKLLLIVKLPERWWWQYTMYLY